MNTLRPNGPALDPDWTVYDRIRLENRVLLERWIKLADMLGAATLLRFEADGFWQPFPAWPLICGPDGLLGPKIDTAELLLPSAPAGALIGRIGGSTAGLDGPPLLAGTTASTAPGADGHPFVIGTGCVLQMPDQPYGPVYVSINAAARPLALGRLTVTLETAHVQLGPPPAPKSSS